MPWNWCVLVGLLSHLFILLIAAILWFLDPKKKKKLFQVIPPGCSLSFPLLFFSSKTIETKDERDRLLTKSLFFQGWIVLFNRAIFPLSQKTIQVVGFPPRPVNDYSTDWRIPLRGHFPAHALPTFFFAQFNPVSVSYTPLENLKKFLSPSWSIVPSNICRWLLFLLSHYLAQPFELSLSSFPVIQCLWLFQFLGICVQNLSFKKCSKSLVMGRSKSPHETFLSETSRWYTHTMQDTDNSGPLIPVA